VGGKMKVPNGRVTQGMPAAAVRQALIRAMRGVTLFGSPEGMQAPAKQG